MQPSFVEDEVVDEDIDEELVDEDGSSDYEDLDDTEGGEGVIAVKTSFEPTNGSMVMITDLREWLKSPYEEI